MRLLTPAPLPGCCNCGAANVYVAGKIVSVVLFAWPFNLAVSVTTRALVNGAAVIGGSALNTPSGTAKVAGTCTSGSLLVSPSTQPGKAGCVKLTAKVLLVPPTIR